MKASAASAAVSAEPNLVCGVKRRRQDKLCFTHDELVCYYVAVKNWLARETESAPIAEDTVDDVVNWSRPQLWHAISSAMAEHSLGHRKPVYWLLDRALRREIVDTCPLLAETLLLQALLPAFVGDPHTKWLPAQNINDVIAQRASQDLFFQGTRAADLRDACRIKTAPPLDPAAIRANIKSTAPDRPWAMVLNLAPRNRAGEHWVALYSDSPDTLEYYDSLGDRLKRKRVIGKSIKQIILSDESDGLCLKQVATKHQTDDHMCGMYACYYILARANGIPFDAFKKNIVTHHEIDAFRKASLVERSSSARQKL